MPPPPWRSWSVRLSELFRWSLAGAVWGCVPQLQEAGSVYLAITGGAASPETQQIDEIEDVVWTDLMPECLWKFRVRDFGPLFVAIDAHGGSQYQAVKDRAAERLAAAYERLGL